MTIYDQPARLLQTLIHYNTTNPPGNERACILYLDGLLQEAGFEITLLAKDADRQGTARCRYGARPWPAWVGSCSTWKANAPRSTSHPWPG